MDDSLPLDLKYRPRKFSDVVGNAAIVQLLRTRSRRGTLAGRSMMFGGPKGCGKTSLARIVARAIVCDELDDGEPCGVCTSCSSVSDESSLSFDEFDAATQGTVDRMRALVQELDYSSADGKPRLVVMDEAQRLSKASQDALLKSMEDRRLVVILCTTEPKKIVEAIRSRVEEYPVSSPPVEDMVKRLASVCDAEGINYESSALATVAAALGCCPRECICALDTMSTLGGVTAENVRSVFRYDRMNLVVDVLRHVDSDPAKALAVLDDLSSEGATWIRDSMVHAISSSMREGVGARPTFPVPTGIFHIRGSGWASLARSLGSIDKPSMADIEARLLSDSSAFLASNPAPPPPMISPSSPPPAPAEQKMAPSSPPAPAPVESKKTHSAPPAEPKKTPSAPPVRAVDKPVPKRSIEVDGVKFSPDEDLTSLDSKIERGTSGPPPPTEPVRAKVEFDRRNVPLSEKDFAAGLLKRVKG